MFTRQGRRTDPHGHGHSVVLHEAAFPYRHPRYDQRRLRINSSHWCGAWRTREAPRTTHRSAFPIKGHAPTSRGNSPRLRADRNCCDRNHSPLKECLRSSSRAGEWQVLAERRQFAPSVWCTGRRTRQPMCLYRWSTPRADERCHLDQVTM